VFPKPAIEALRGSARPGRGEARPGEAFFFSSSLADVALWLGPNM